jgi:antitoxin component YwqK of YwqJK toxin-antitoxin module
MLLLLPCLGQQPKYTFKSFVHEQDTAEFKISYPSNKGIVRTYVKGGAQIFDLDDDSTTYVMSEVGALLCFEGQERNKKREGIFKVYVIDSADHSKRYKIWEQTFVNDKLNGQWRTYTLRGSLVNFKTFMDDSLNGISINYWIDGKSVMDEQEFFNGRARSIRREYYKNGKVETETPLVSGVVTGVVKAYYETGAMKETQEVRDGKADGVRKYYYPNGQLWIEQTYKAGKNWEIRGNYTDKGQARDAGTLHEGNGTVIFYNDDGSVREVKTYINGDEKQQEDPPKR